MFGPKGPGYARNKQLATHLVTRMYVLGFARINNMTMGEMSEHTELVDKINYATLGTKANVIQAKSLAMAMGLIREIYSDEEYKLTRNGIRAARNAIRAMKHDPDTCLPLL